MTNHGAPDDLLRGLQFQPLAAGWTPVDAIALVKCFDGEGHPTWAFRKAESMNDEELLGAVAVRLELLKQQLVEDCAGSEDD